MTRGNNTVKSTPGQPPSVSHMLSGLFLGVSILKLWNGFNHVSFFWEFGDCYIIMVRYKITGHIMVVANYYRTSSFQ